MSKIEVEIDDGLGYSLGMISDVIINIADSFEKMRRLGVK